MSYNSNLNHSTMSDLYCHENISSDDEVYYNTPKRRLKVLKVEDYNDCKGFRKFEKKRYLSDFSGEEDVIIEDIMSLDLFEIFHPKTFEPIIITKSL